jgi:predicted dehydrogenase
MINWGIIGLGNMSYKFINAIKEIENTKIVAVASLSKKKSDNLINIIGIDESQYYSNYEDLIKSPNVDAIYIATLNNTHFDLIKQCSLNKKKILCEKPMTVNYNEAKEAFKFIKDNKTSFLEAFVFRHHKQSQNLSDIIRKGEIGDIYEVESSFGYKVKKTNPYSRIFNKDLGGGSILDVGCYTTSFCLMIAKIIFEQKVLNIKVENIKGNIGVTGVDESAEASLIFDTNIKMSIKTSLREELENNCTIYGSKGKIIIPSPWVPDKKSVLEIYTGNTYYKQFLNSKLSAYAQQIDFFNKRNFNDKKNLVDTFMSNEESLLNMKIIGEWKNGLL